MAEKLWKSPLVDLFEKKLREGYSYVAQGNATVGIGHEEHRTSYVFLSPMTASWRANAFDNLLMGSCWLAQELHGTNFKTRRISRSGPAVSRLPFEKRLI